MAFLVGVFWLSRPKAFFVIEKPALVLDFIAGLVIFGSSWVQQIILPKGFWTDVDQSRSWIIALLGLGSIELSNKLIHSYVTNIKDIERQTGVCQDQSLLTYLDLERQNQQWIAEERLKQSQEFQPILELIVSGIVMILELAPLIPDNL